MKRNVNGYTYEISEVEDGFSIVITKPNGDKHISHSYIRTYAINKVNEIINEYRHSSRK